MSDFWVICSVFASGFAIFLLKRKSALELLWQSTENAKSDLQYSYIKVGKHLTMIAAVTGPQGPALPLLCPGQGPTLGACKVSRLWSWPAAQMPVLSPAARGPCGPEAGVWVDDWAALTITAVTHEPSFQASKAVSDPVLTACLSLVYRSC